MQNKTDLKTESAVAFVRLQTPAIFDYLRDLLQRPACCFPCQDRPAEAAAAGWSGNAEWYSDIGPGRNVALLCDHHKAIYEAELVKNRLPYREEYEPYVFEHSGPFFTNPQPPTIKRGLQ